MSLLNREGGSVGRNWVYIFDHRNGKKLIPVEITDSGTKPLLGLFNREGRRVEPADNNVSIWRMLIRGF